MSSTIITDAIAANVEASTNAAKMGEPDQALKYAQAAATISTPSVVSALS